jgi:hypothetical protein
MQTLKTDISVMEAIAAFERCAKVNPRRVALHEAVGEYRAPATLAKQATGVP